MNYDNLFFDDMDDEAEVDSLVFNFFKDVALLIQASTSTIRRNPQNHIKRGRHGAHDRLVKAYFTEEPLKAYFTRKNIGFLIWHAFSDVAGSNNDINVLRQSPVLNDLKVEKAPEVPFVANDVNYKWGYYLTDGIYPEWAILIKSISQPGSNDTK
ncbi:ALP1-like protein isoform X1 [Tanacetum coccineum]